MKKKELFMMMSLSTIQAVTPAVAAVDVQALCHNPAAVRNQVSAASGNGAIFTLGAGAIPTTERSRLGDQRLRVLEGQFATKLSLMKDDTPTGGCCSKTIDCEISPEDGCVNDTDLSF